MSSTTSVVQRVYLGGYNAVQLGAWAVIISGIVKNWKKKRNPNGRDNFIAQGVSAVWGDTSAIVAGSHVVALLEAAHPLLKLVSGSATEPLLQVLGRLFNVFVVVDNITPSTKNPLLLSLLTSWGSSDIIRYAYYFMKQTGYCPEWLKWLRYNAFLVLYPIGMFSEISLILNALYLQYFESQEKKKAELQAASTTTTTTTTAAPATKRSDVKLNWIHNGALIFFFLSSFYTYPYMFNHMLKQRAKYLGTK